MKRSSVRPSVCLLDQSLAAAACGASLLLSALRTGDIDRELPTLSSNGATARCSAANAGSVMLTAEGRG